MACRGTSSSALDNAREWGPVNLDAAVGARALKTAKLPIILLPTVIAIFVHGFHHGSEILQPGVLRMRTGG
jgi:hypothetical protein